MILPKFWGHGQLFAFSALDGTSYASDDFTGMLSGDKIGIRFFSKVKRELMLVNVRGRFMEFDAVTSDYIRFHFPHQAALRIIYAAQHLIIGNVAGEIFPVVLTEGASLRAWANLMDRGQVPQDQGVSPLDCAFCGGGFPIRLTNGEFVGAAIVSNLPHREDHRFIASALADYLHKENVPCI